MSVTIDDLFSDFLAEMQQTGSRYSNFIPWAEEAGYPTLAKLFRAILASEIVRQERIRIGLDHHARESHDYFVCPHCGLIFIPDAPGQCPVDETPGEKFERIS